MAYADVENPTAVLTPLPDTGEGVKSLIESAGWKVQGVNWIWEKVTGKNLVEQLITPLLGDFDKIGNDAKAWKDGVAKSLDGVRNNLNAGLTELENGWDGKAADSFKTRVSTVWTAGIELDSQLALKIGGIFESVAAASKLACTGAIAGINFLVDKLVELAIKAVIPGPGWAAAVLMVENLIDLVESIIKIIQAIEQMIRGVGELIKGIVELGTALIKIKDVRSVNDAANALDDVRQGQDTITTAKSEVVGGALKAAWYKGSANRSLGKINKAGGGTGE